MPWLAGLMLAALTFSLWPGLDLAVSGFFFDGAGFPWQSEPLTLALRNFLYAAEDTCGVLAFPLAFWARRRGTVLGQGARVWLFQGLVFALGPLIWVNGIAKPLWARPRPFRITEFGGDFAFQPIWQLNGACPGNCSFSSGEMAGAVALSLMAAMLAHANRDRLGRLFRAAQVLALLPMPFTAFQRIAAGRHFLSDVVFSLLAVGLIAVVLARLMRQAPTAGRC